MTNQEINEKLAVLHGFSKEEPWNDGRECWSHKDSPSHVGFEEIPDFAGDLNVVNAAWKRLSPDQKKKYKEILAEVVFRESLGMEYVSLEDLENDVYGITMNASSRQRSRALIELLTESESKNAFVEVKRRLIQCDNCKKVVDIEEDSGHHPGCDFIYGRRGWRQLGAYDG